MLLFDSQLKLSRHIMQSPLSHPASEGLVDRCIKVVLSVRVGP